MKLYIILDSCHFPVAHLVRMYVSVHNIADSIPSENQRDILLTDLGVSRPSIMKTGYLTW